MNPKAKGVRLGGNDNVTFKVPFPAVELLFFGSPPSLSSFWGVP
jgi:hypothetical protein